MTMINTPGLIYPPLPPGFLSQGFASNTLIDATGEKIAKMGRIWWRDYVSGTKNIDKVHFRFGTVVKAGGSGLTLSLQDVDAATGPVMQPDGTQDQSVAIANGNALFASNTWFTSGSLNSQRTVAFGDLFAAVLEFDGSGRLGSDSVIMSTINSASYSSTEGTALYTGSWTLPSQSSMNILFEFSDGTFGTFRSALAVSNPSVVLYQAASNPDEWASKITIPFKCVVEGAVMHNYVQSAGGDFEVRLETAGGTLLASVTQDSNQLLAVNSGNYQRYLFSSPVTLNAGDVVYLCTRALGLGSTAISLADVTNVNHWQAASWGSSSNAASRNNGGAWTDVPTRRLGHGLSISQIDDGAGGGGGLLQGNLRGNMQ